MLYRLLIWKNAWGIRFIALSFLVLLLGIGSQVLVRAVASNAHTGFLEVKVSASTVHGKMADGNWAHPGACSGAPSQFDFGTLIALYNPDGSFNQQCIVEDIHNDGYNHIEILMPGNAADALHWGVHNLLARVARFGWGNDAPFQASSKAGSIVPARPAQEKNVLHSKH